VAGRVTRLDEQAERVAALQPDVVCLQEATPRTVPRWSEHLARAGLEHVRAGDPAAARSQGRSRPLLVLTAACVPLSGEDVPGAPWPERVLATRTAGGALVVNVHSPISPKPDLVKVRTHEAVHRYLTAEHGPALVCGDLNTPRKEHPDGRVWTFARTRYGNLRPERGERWDAAELALIKGLEPHGFSDAFRALHGLEVRELSWEWPRWGGGYRLDHLIVSTGVRPREVRYLHEWRRDGLSDHSPLWAELTLDV
jgi:endonuclease/exonuclease/phosphatase family metal-dependent hydrolase